MKTVYTEKEFSVTSGKVYLSATTGSGQLGFHGLEIGGKVFDPESDFKDSELGNGNSLKTNDTLVEIVSTVAMMNPSSNSAIVTYILEDDNNREEWVVEIKDNTHSYAAFLTDIVFT